jgi:short-subunit dehydrogenase
VKVVVTGASSGIGAATALALAEGGHTVLTCARREDRLAALGLPYVVADLAELEALDALVDRFETELGGVDVLVNNAGVPKRRRVRAMSPADLEDVMAINYLSPARLSLAVLPRMLERGSGHLVNVSSMGVHSAAFGVSAYSASKAALELFTEGLYLELAGSGVHAHLVVPGTTRTEFSEDKPGNEPSMVRSAPGAATPEQVAAAVVACLGTEDFVTYATEGDARTSAAKAADVNGVLAAARDSLKAFL